MPKQTYAISSGSYDDYRVDRILVGKVGADFQVLFDEFIDLYHKVTPQFTEPEPERDYRHDPDDWYDKAYTDWTYRKYDHDEASIKAWNERGYAGDEKTKLFTSWLIKDKGFTVVEYYEFNTDNLHEKHPAYYRVEMTTPAPGPEGGTR